MFLLAEASYALPAFPGAEGFGADTVGGRGGVVYKVTTLASDGPGSLREAVNATGPRIVVFEVSGIIKLTSSIKIDDPFITIAGQTSPGGILITGDRFKINTHDVVIRYLRFRLGSHDGVDPEKARAVEIYGDGQYYDNKGYNVVLDHCSFSWAADTVVTVGEDAYDITISWSIISEGLNSAGHPDGEHSYGILYWGKYTDPSRNYSFHHNYLPHNGGRNPEINYYGTLDAVNNVAYNYVGGKTPKASGKNKVNWIYNYTKPGASSNSADSHFEVRHKPSSTGSIDKYVYALGNMGVKRTDQSDPTKWLVGYDWSSDLISEDFRSLTELVPSPVSDTVMTYDYAQEILTTVGASLPVRDSVDSRVVADFAAGTGDLIDDVSYPSDFPSFSSPAAPVDDDNDGMSDVWEVSNGLNSKSNDSAGDADGDGYTNIEEYLHHLAGAVSAQPIVSPPVPPSGLKGTTN